MSETAGKLEEGISSNQFDKKSVKYSVGFDGILPCISSVFASAKYSSEDIALLEVVMNHIEHEKGHQNIYVLVGDCNLQEQ